MDFHISNTAIISFCSILLVVIAICFFCKRNWINDRISRIKNNGFLIIITSSFILALVAFIVSVSALYCNRCGYCCNSDSIVVGAFGVIVTLLVGWDIYKMIDLNKKIENSLNGQDAKIENIKTQLDNKTQEIERRIEAKTAELEKRVDEQINIRSHEVDYINTFRLMNVLSQENPYDMKVKCLTFCLSDMNKLDRVKNSTILEEVRKAHEDNVFNNASINILKTFISELSKALNNDSVLLNDITSIYNKKTNNPTQNIPATPPAPTGE